MKDTHHMKKKGFKRFKGNKWQKENEYRARAWTKSDQEYKRRWSEIMNHQKGLERTKSFPFFFFLLRKENLTRKTTFFQHVYTSILGKLPLCCTCFVWIVFKQPKCKDICSTKPRGTVTSTPPMVWPSACVTGTQVQAGRRGRQTQRASTTEPRLQERTT